jgi:DNA-binding transcriptional LysR family regulator
MTEPDRLYLMKLFVEIIHLGTFKAAAQEMGITQSKATKDIKRLEASLGSILLNRTTRSVGITRAGEIYYDAAINILGDYDKLIENLNFAKNRLSGELRITAPQLWGDVVLTPLIVEFKRKYSDVSVVANYSDHFVDLYRENVHLAFRATIPEDEPYLSQKICADTTVICASSRYFDESNIPEVPGALENLDFITYGQEINRYSRLVLKRGGQTSTVTVSGKLSFSSMRSVYSAMRKGLGVASVPMYLAQSDIQDGSVVELLPEYELQKVWFHAFYTERKKDSKLASTFIDFVRERTK